MQQGTIIFRPGEAKDCEQLAKVKYQVWQSTYQGIYPQEKLDSYDWEAQRESFQRILKRKTAQLLVAVEGETIVGYLCWGLSWRERSLGEPQIVLLSVQKEYQGRGIGKALFSLGKESLREKGYPEFFVFCNKYNYPAQGFDRAMGGIAVSTDPDDPDGSIPQIRYRLDLASPES